MFRKAIPFGLFLAALIGVSTLSSDTIGAADGAKKKAEPIKSDDLFKKLDTNKDKVVDLDEFKMLFDVQPEPKAKKGKEAEKFDLAFIFKSLDADGNKSLSAEEFKGIIGSVFPPPKK